MTPEEHWNQIRDLAYQIWEDCGRPEGQHQKHWDEARRRLSERRAARPGLTPADDPVPAAQDRPNVVAPEEPPAIPPHSTLSGFVRRQ